MVDFDDSVRVQLCTGSTTGIGPKSTSQDPFPMMNAVTEGIATADEVSAFADEGFKMVGRFTPTEQPEFQEAVRFEAPEGPDGPADDGPEQLFELRYTPEGNTYVRKVDMAAYRLGARSFDGHDRDKDTEEAGEEGAEGNLAVLAADDHGDDDGDHDHDHDHDHEADGGRRMGPVSKDATPSVKVVERDGRVLVTSHSYPYSAVGVVGSWWAGSLLALIARHAMLSPFDIWLSDLTHV